MGLVDPWHVGSSHGLGQVEEVSSDLSNLTHPPPGKGEPDQVGELL